MLLPCLEVELSMLLPCLEVELSMLELRETT